MPLAGFLPKVVSPIKIQILHAKIYSGGPQGPLTLRMSKFGSKNLKHKNSGNSESIGSSDLKFTYKVPCLYVHTMSAKFQPPIPKQFKSYCTKRFIFNSFQDP